MEAINSCEKPVEWAVPAIVCDPALRDVDFSKITGDARAVILVDFDPNEVHGSVKSALRAKLENGIPVCLISTDPEKSSSDSLGLSAIDLRNLPVHRHRELRDTISAYLSEGVLGIELTKKLGALFVSNDTKLPNFRLEVGQAVDEAVELSIR